MDEWADGCAGGTIMTQSILPRSKIGGVVDPIEIWALRSLSMLMYSHFTRVY